MRSFTVTITIDGYPVALFQLVAQSQYDADRVVQLMYPNLQFHVTEGWWFG
jgi:hypothetical protein